MNFRSYKFLLSRSKVAVLCIRSSLVSFLFFFGCMSSHYDRTENFTFSWKIGDFEQAAKEAENLAKKGPSRDRMLYRLEEGATKRIQGNLSW